MALIEPILAHEQLQQLLAHLLEIVEAPTDDPFSDLLDVAMTE